MGSLLWFSQAVDAKISSGFFKLGGSIYDNPYKFLIIPVIACLACTPGFSSFRQEYNAESLYTPQNAEAFEDRKVIEQTFGFGPRQDVIYAVNTNEGAAVVTRDNMLAWYDIYQEVVDMEEAKAVDGDDWKNQPGVPVNYTTVCYGFEESGVCYVKSILAFWDYNRTLIAEKTTPELVADLDAGTARELSGQTVRLADVAAVDADGTVVALRMTFMLQNNKAPQPSGPDDDPRAYEWEYNRYLTTPDVTPGVGTSLKLYSYNQAAQREAGRSTIQDDIFLLTMGYFLLISYAVVVLSRGNPVHSHGSLAFASLAAIGLSIVACYGLASAFKIPFSGVIQTLSFLLLGLGMDDTFVLVAAFNQPDVLNRPPKERVQVAMSRAGASITVTSVTDVTAFLVGSITDIPAIRDFCLYAAIGITFIFIMQITFFVTLMIFSAHREAKGRRDWCCCLTAADPDKNCCSQSQFDKNSFEEPLTRFLRDWYAPRLLSTAGKAVVIVISVALVGVSAYFISMLEVNMDPEWFVPEGSPMLDTFAIRGRYFGSKETPTTIYTFDVDYTAAPQQRELQLISSATEASRYYVDGSCRNWWPLFLAYVQTQNAADITDNVIATDKFYQHFATFLTDESSKSVRSSFVLDGTRLVGTEIPCRFVGDPLEADQTRTAHLIDCMDDSRDIAKLGPNLGRARAYFQAYVWWDGLKVVYDQILLNVILAVSAVFLICLVLLGSLPGALIVFVMLVMIDVDVLGSYYYYGEQINYVSGIFLVIAVGLSVDALAHITHTFLDSEGTGNERATRALEVIGRSVLNGGISTLIVLVPLSTANSYIFQVFFKCFFSIIGHSLWHGFVLLPVVLSIVQPTPFAEIRAKLGIEEPDHAKVTPSDSADLTGKKSPGGSSIPLKVITNI